MIIKQNIALVTVVSLFVISLSISNADAVIYMKIEGIDGEATVPVPGCSNECIEIHSFQFGVGRSVSDSSPRGERSTDPPSISEITVTKTMDSTSPKIFTETVAGDDKDIRIFLVRNDGKLFAEYILNDSIFSGYSASSGGERPSESISFNFVKLDVIYTQFNSEGKPIKTVTACWDIANNEVCESSGGGGGDIDPDSDGDGTPDSSDFCPADPVKTNPGICGCGVADTDSDSDGIANCNDNCPLDPANDVDGDLVCGNVDNCPADSNADQLDTDSDLAGNACDADDDNDGLYDNVDVEPFVSSREFSNSLLGGNEFGFVLSGFVVVADVGNGEQLSFNAADDSQVSACDLAILSLSLGDEVLVDCGSITVTVVSGSVAAEYTVGGETATATLDEGESLTFDPDTASFSAGDDSEVEITIGGQTITIGANQTITVHSVDVDIKPDDVQNIVNMQAKGVLPVAILSSAEFDATTVDPLSVKFGPNEATESHKRGHIEDVNRDGLKDMMLHFNIQDIGISENTTELELFGMTTDGNVIRGSDSIVLKGQKIKQN